MEDQADFWLGDAGKYRRSGDCMTSKTAATAAFALLASLLSCVGAFAQDAPAKPIFLLELNKAEMNSGNCYFSFLIYNRTTTSLKGISYNLSLLDKDGQITANTVMPILPMPPNQSRIKTFGLAITCASIAGIIAETAECTDVDGATSTVCDEALFRSKAADVQFPWQPQLDDLL